jgi:hypothetical protein
MHPSEQPFSAYGANTQVFMGLVVFTYIYFVFLHALVYRLPDLAALRTYLDTQTLSQLIGSAREEPSKIFAPWFCWVALAFALVVLLWRMGRRNYEANNPDEQKLVNRWREAATAASCEDNLASSYVAAENIEIRGVRARVAFIPCGQSVSLAQIEQSLVDKGLVAQVAKTT